ncbi:hypothetical protein [Nonomuraea typhae]|uniref:hypothetical protein n=1 Tax=Nonomuraea typhae TaxID=2603600 RepID=UPI0012F78831|nr:hypothetical protein [Nonomuraea typhae]
MRSLRSETRGQAAGRCDGVRQRRGIVEREQVGQPDVIGIAAPLKQAASGVHHDAGLSHARRADSGHQP